MKKMKKWANEEMKEWTRKWRKWPNEEMSKWRNEEMNTKWRNQQMKKWRNWHENEENDKWKHKYLYCQIVLLGFTNILSFSEMISFCEMIIFHHWKCLSEFPKYYLAFIILENKAVEVLFRFTNNDRNSKYGKITKTFNWKYNPIAIKHNI